VQRSVLTKNKIKHIRSLSQKKYRESEGVFIAEGFKAVSELLPLLPCVELYVTEDFKRQDVGNRLLGLAASCTDISQTELEKISALRTPRSAVGIFRIPEAEKDAAAWDEIPHKALCLALDGVQDPGNMGTIVRLADWFGITHILASPSTADVFSPKVVQATMGAVGRIRVRCEDLPTRLARLSGVPVYGTYLGGDNIYQAELTQTGIIVMGNEGSGISPEVSRYVTHRLHIPAFSVEQTASESLNVAVATAITCAEFRRRTYTHQP